MGDSITDGWDDPKYGGFFPGKPYVDRGISGQTTPQMLIRFRPDVIASAPERGGHSRRVPTDIAGNTGPMTLEAIEDNLTSMSAACAGRAGSGWCWLRFCPSAITLRPGKVSRLFAVCRDLLNRSQALNEWMKKYAAATGAVYLDYYSAMVDEHGFLKDELSDDGLHPNQKGYDLMAPLAERAIAAVLKKN